MMECWEDVVGQVGNLSGSGLIRQVGNLPHGSFSLSFFAHFLADFCSIGLVNGTGVFDTSGGRRRGVVGWWLVANRRQDDFESRVTGLVNGDVDWAIPGILRPLLGGNGWPDCRHLLYEGSGQPTLLLRSKRRPWGVCWSIKFDFSTKNFYSAHFRVRGGGWAHIFLAGESAVTDYGKR
jgi:hypothetical protein